MNFSLNDRKLRVRFFIYGPLFLLFVLSVSFSYAKYRNIQESIKTNEAAIVQSMILLSLAKEYQTLKVQIDETKNKYPDIDLKTEEEGMIEIRKAIVAGDINIAKQSLIEVKQAVTLKTETKIADEARKGVLSGKIIDSAKKALKATAQIVKDGKALADVQSGEDGIFTTKLYAGKYQIKVSLSGYQDYTKDVDISAEQVVNLEILLNKKLAAATTPDVAYEASTPVAADDGNYQKTSVETPVGTFTVYLMSFDLSQYEMRVDTAADEDCTNECPVKSLKEFISQNNAIAGIHGTYFCPTSYSTCAGETNSFYYKLFNSRLGKKINWSNGLGDYLPFLAIDGGSAEYYSTWAEAKDVGMTAGISCRPNLVSGGEVVVTENDLDSDKERYSKISHGFIGLKSNTVYVGIVLSVTVLDEAQAVKALGVEYAMNIDGGGTSAMYYNGSYKVGPGRDMPNAIVFVKR